MPTDMTPIPDGQRPRLLFRASLLGAEEERPREWVLRDWVPSGVVSLLGGDGGVGKSLIALQLAVATATGTSFLGLPVKPGPAVLIAAEDEKPELHRRLVPICGEVGVSINDLDNLHILPLAGEDALLAVPESGTNAMGKTRLLDALSEEVREVSPVLIVIDTLADVFGGHELDRGHVRSFITRLRGSLCVDGAAVLLLAHPSLAGMKDGRAASGSTAWTNSARAALHLKSDETGLRTMSVVKSNYGPTGLDLNMRWRDGAFAIAALGDVPAKFKSQTARNSERAKADARRLSDALPPGEVSRDLVGQKAAELGLLSGVKIENQRSKISKLLKRVKDFRGGSHAG